MAQISGTMIAGLAMADGLGSLAYAGVAEVAGVSGAYRLAGITLLVAAVVGWLIEERIPDTHLLDRGELPSRRGVT
jgi:aspartate oxidase